MVDSLTGLLSRDAFLLLADRDRHLAETMHRRQLLILAEPKAQFAPTISGRDLGVVDAAEQLRNLAGATDLVARVGLMHLALSVLDSEQGVRGGDLGSVAWGCGARAEFRWEWRCSIRSGRLRWTVCWNWRLVICNRSRVSAYPLLRALGKALTSGSGRRSRVTIVLPRVCRTRRNLQHWPKPFGSRRILAQDPLWTGSGTSRGVVLLPLPPQQVPASLREHLPANAHRRLLHSAPRADIFHALNQRVDHKAPRTVTTFHDLFVMSGDVLHARLSRALHAAGPRSRGTQRPHHRRFAVHCAIRWNPC